MIHFPRRRMAAFFAVSALASLTVAAATSTPAAADNHPPIDATTLRELPQKTNWGVVNQDPAALHNFDNLVWDFAQIGNTMYVGGSFLDVQKGRNGSPERQSYLAAFNVDSGVWIATFRPTITGAVWALEVSPNGSLLVGGQFSSVNGQPNTSALVALDPTTGAVDTRFGASVARPGSSEPAIVRALEVVGSQLYVAGNFSRVVWSQGTRYMSVGKLVRVDAGNGNPDTIWRPQIGGGSVWGFGIDRDRGRMHVGGISISSINGVATTRFGTIDLTTGALVPNQQSFGWNNTSALDMWDVEVAGGKVFTAGTEHMVQILDGETRARVGYHHTGLAKDGFEFGSAVVGGVRRTFVAGGDFQVVEQVGDWVFAGCHCTYETRYGLNTWYDGVAGSRSPIQLVGAINATTGRVDDWSPDLAGSADGVWAIGSDTRGCLWVGGDLDTAGVQAGSAFWVGNFARFCPPGVGDKDTVSPTAPTDLTAAQVGAGVALTWTAATDNVGVVGYVVIRDAVEVATTAMTSWTDPAPALGWHTYKVKAIDGAGNRSGNSNARSVNVQ